MTIVTITRSGVRCTVTAVDTAPGLKLAARLAAALATTSPRTTGAAVHDARTGTYCGLRDGQLFYAASVDKVTTVSALLWQRQRVGKGLTAEEKGWARRAITLSDNDAQSALWLRVGRGCGVRTFLRAAGMTRTLTDPGGRWGVTRTTAADQIALLDQLTHGPLLTPANRRYLLGLMRAVTTAQRWGVPVGAPARARVANKNGWLPYRGSWRINSIGHVQGIGPGAVTDDYTVALLSAGSPSLTAGMRTLNTIARVVHAGL